MGEMTDDEVQQFLNEEARLNADYRFIVSGAVADDEIIIVSGHGPGGGWIDKEGRLSVSAAKITGLSVDNRDAGFTPTGPAFYGVEERAAMEARIAELERQRDAVLALHRHRENHIVCVHDDEIWPCPTAAALGVREDERGQPIKPEPFAPEGETGQFIERGERG